jgi:hypothetical protein
MELSTTWEPISHVATEEIPSILWNLKVHYRRYKSCPSVPMLSQTNLAHITQSYRYKIHLNVIHHLCLGLLSCLFPTNNLYMFHFSPIHATWPTHLTLLNLIMLIILGAEYKLCSSSLCSFRHPPVSSSLFGPNILLSTLYSNTVSLWSSLNVRDHVSHPYRTKGEIRVLHVLIFTFSVSRWEDRRFWTEWYSDHLWKLNNRVPVSFTVSRMASVDTKIVRIPLFLKCENALRLGNSEKLCSPWYTSEKLCSPWYTSEKLCSPLYTACLYRHFRCINKLEMFHTIYFMGTIYILLYLLWGRILSCLYSQFKQPQIIQNWICYSI